MSNSFDVNQYVSDNKALLEAPEPAAVAPAADFDVGGYVAENEEHLQTKEEGDIGIGESIGRGAVQAVTLGFSDEITAALESFLFPTKTTYDKALKESRANYKAAEKAHGGAYLAGEIAGGVGSLLIPGAGAAMASGKAAVAAGKAAVVGGIAGAGYSEEKEINEIAKDVATGAIAGAGLSGLFSAAGKIIKKGGDTVGKKAGTLMDRVATKAENSHVGMTDDAQAALRRQGHDPEKLVNTMRDQGLIKVEKVEKILERTKTANQAANEAVANVRSQLDDIASRNNVKSFHVSATEAVDEIAQKHLAGVSDLEMQKGYTKAVNGILKDIKTKAPKKGAPMPENTPRFGTDGDLALDDPSQHMGWLKKGLHAVGKDMSDGPAQPITGNELDKVVRHLRTTSVGTHRAAEEHAAKRMSFREAHDILGYLEQGVKDSGGFGAPANAKNKAWQDVYQSFKGYVEKKEDHVLKAVSKPDLAQDLAKNRELARATEAMTGVLEGKIKENGQKTFMSQAETSAMLYAAATGNIALAGGMAARKGVAKYQGALAAKAARRLATVMKDSGKYGTMLQDAAKKGPIALVATHLYLYDNEDNYRNQFKKD